MANNRWDFSDILLQQRAGQIMGQAYAGAGQQVGDIFKQHGEQIKQNKLMRGRIDAGLDLAQSIAKNPYATKDQIDHAAQLSQYIADPKISDVEKFSKVEEQTKNLSTMIQLGGFNMQQKAFEDKQAQQNAANTYFANLERAGSQGANAQTNQNFRGGTNAQYQQSQSDFTKAALDIRRMTGALPSGENLTDLYKTFAIAGKPTAPKDKEIAVQSFVDNYRVTHEGKFPPPDVLSGFKLRLYSPQPQIAPPAPGTAVTVDPETGAIVSKTIENTPEVLAKNKAKEDLTRNLSGAVHGLLRLNSEGAMVNPENDFLSNITARVSASKIGQGLAGAAGTRTQGIRDRLNNAAPAILQSIIKSSGLTSTQINSNKELEFWLKQIGRDDQDIFTRLSALHAVDKTFGAGNVLESILGSESPEFINALEQNTGIKINNAETPSANTDKKPKPIPLVGEIREGHKFKGGNPYDENNWEKL